MWASLGARWSLWLILALQAGILGWQSAAWAPVSAEVPHLAAGIVGWQTGRFNFYTVNPPLAKAVAALPVVLQRPEVNWRAAARGPKTRHEFELGNEFVRKNAERWRRHLLAARCASIPFALLGTTVCYFWARELHRSGWCAACAALLFAFSPTVLTWGSTIQPDVAAASIGALAAWRFWHWLRGPTWLRASVAAVALGLAELCKFTWIILFGLWPLLWLACLLARGRKACATGVCHSPVTRPGTIAPRRHAALREFTQLACILAGGVYVINVGYGFEGSFKPLGSYNFLSRSLAGNRSIHDLRQGGNRFAGSALANIPLPLPEHYVRGIDLQKIDFESGWTQYIMGEWKKRGRWYFSIAAIALKEPLGTICLGMLALALAILAIVKRGWHFGWRLRRGSGGGQAAASHGDSTWNQLFVAAHAASLFVLLSANPQVAFLRYALPCYPFAMILLARAALAFRRKRHWLAATICALIVWSVASSAHLLPHSLSYFNELAGGPFNGHRCLLSSQWDAGQDLFRFVRWRERNRAARPLYCRLESALPLNLFSPELQGLPPSMFRQSPTASAGAPDSGQRNGSQAGIMPGWFALTPAAFLDADGHYRALFEGMEPVDRIAYSIWIYHVTLEDANRLRRLFGLDELPPGEPG